jgi:transposase InsO family protein
MDFVSDGMSRGRVIWMLTLVDVCTRECPAIEVDTSLGGLRVRRELDRRRKEVYQRAIVWDNGLEFRVRDLAAWSEEPGGRLGVRAAGQACTECVCGKASTVFRNGTWPRTALLEHSPTRACGQR